MTQHGKNESSSESTQDKAGPRSVPLITAPSPPPTPINTTPSLKFLSIKNSNGKTHKHLYNDQFLLFQNLDTVFEQSCDDFHNDSPSSATTSSLLPGQPSSQCSIKPKQILLPNDLLDESNTAKFIYILSVDGQLFQAFLPDRALSKRNASQEISEDDIFSQPFAYIFEDANRTATTSTAKESTASCKDAVVPDFQKTISKSSVSGSSNHSESTVFIPTNSDQIRVTHIHQELRYQKIGLTSQNELIALATNGIVWRHQAASPTESPVQLCSEIKQIFFSEIGFFMQTTRETKTDRNYLTHTHLFCYDPRFLRFLETGSKIAGLEREKRLTENWQSNEMWPMPLFELVTGSIHSNVKFVNIRWSEVDVIFENKSRGEINNLAATYPISFNRKSIFGSSMTVSVSIDEQGHYRYRRGKHTWSAVPDKNNNETWNLHGSTESIDKAVNVAGYERPASRHSMVPDKLYEIVQEHGTKGQKLYAVKWLDNGSIDLLDKDDLAKMVKKKTQILRRSRAASVIDSTRPSSPTETKRDDDKAIRANVPTSTDIIDGDFEKHLRQITLPVTLGRDLILSLTDDFIVMKRALYARQAPRIASIYHIFDTQEPAELFVFPQDCHSARVVRVSSRITLVFGLGKHRTTILKLLKTKDIAKSDSGSQAWSCVEVKSLQMIEDVKRVGDMLFLQYCSKSALEQLLQHHLESGAPGNANEPKTTCLNRTMEYIEEHIADAAKASRNALTETIYGLSRSIRKRTSDHRITSADMKLRILRRLAAVPSGTKCKTLSPKVFDFCIETADYVALLAVYKRLSAPQTKLLLHDFKTTDYHKLCTWKSQGAGGESHKSKAHLSIQAMYYRCMLFKKLFLAVNETKEFLDVFEAMLNAYMKTQQALRVAMHCSKDDYRKSGRDRSATTFPQSLTNKVMIKWQDSLEKVEDVPAKLNMATKFPYAALEICFRTRFLLLVQAMSSDQLISMLLQTSTSPIFTQIMIDILPDAFCVQSDDSHPQISAFNKFCKAVAQCLTMLTTLQNANSKPLLHGYKSIQSLRWSVLDGLADGQWNNIQKVCMKKLVSGIVEIERGYQDSGFYNAGSIFEMLTESAKSLVTPMLCSSAYPVLPHKNWSKHGFVKNERKGRYTQADGIGLDSDSLFYITNIYNSNDLYFEGDDGYEGRQYEVLKRDIQIKKSSSRVARQPSQSLEQARALMSTAALYETYQLLAAGFHAVITLILDLDTDKTFKFEISQIWAKVSNMFETLERSYARQRVIDTASTSGSSDDEKSTSSGASIKMVEMEDFPYILKLLSTDEIDLDNSGTLFEPFTVIFDILLYLRVTMRTTVDEETIDTPIITPTLEITDAFVPDGGRPKFSLSASKPSISPFFKHSQSVSGGQIGTLNRGSLRSTRGSTKRRHLRRVPSAVPLAVAGSLMNYESSPADMFGNKKASPELAHFKNCLTTFAKIPRFFFDSLPYSNYHYSIIYRFISRKIRHQILQTRTYVERGIRAGYAQEYQINFNKLDRVDRHNMLESTSEKVTKIVEASRSGSAPPCMHFVNEPNMTNYGKDAPYLEVTFKDENGYGPGVDMSFYKSYGDAMKSCKKFTLPLLWKTETADGFLPVYFENMADKEELEKRNRYFFTLGYVLGASIFNRSDSAGYQNEDTWQRCVGFRFSRPFSKLILGHEVRFHDLAFFDQELFSSLRNLLTSVDDGQLDAGALTLDFTVELPAEEADETRRTVELVEGGSEVQVTNANVFDYVQAYSSRRMIKNYTACAKLIRQGITSYINPNLEDTFINNLSLLDAEDFSLIMAGEKVFDLKHLKEIIHFTTDSRRQVAMEANKQVFMEMLDQLKTDELFDLWFFWTGRANFVAISNAGGRHHYRYEPPTVIFREPNGHRRRLPTAATCSKELSVDGNDTLEVLLDNVRYALKCKDFGNY